MLTNIHTPTIHYIITYHWEWHAVLKSHFCTTDFLLFGAFTTLFEYQRVLVLLKGDVISLQKSLALVEIRVSAEVGWKCAVAKTLIHSPELLQNCHQSQETKKPKLLAKKLKKMFIQLEVHHRRSFRYSLAKKIAWHRFLLEI